MVRIALITIAAVLAAGCPAPIPPLDTFNPSTEWRFSADGSRIAFLAYLDLDVAPVTGGKAIQIAQSVGTYRWSPEDALWFTSSPLPADMNVAPDGMTGVRLQEHLTTAADPIFSPDGTHAAYMTGCAMGRGSLRVAPAAGGTATLISESAACSWAAFSRDGALIWFLADYDGVAQEGTLESAPAGGGMPTALASSVSGFSPPQFTPDGGLWFLTDMMDSGGTLEFAAPGGTPVAIASGVVANYPLIGRTAYGLSPDGRAFAWLSDCNPAFQCTLSVQPSPGAATVSIATGVATWGFSPDGSQIAFGIPDDAGAAAPFSVGVSAVSGGSTAMAAVHASSFVWSPDSGHLALERNCVFGTNCVLAVIPAVGGIPIQITDRETPGSVIWAPSGDRLWFVEGPSDDIISSLEAAPITGESPSPIARVYGVLTTQSPDGNHLAFVAADHPDANLNHGAPLPPGTLEVIPAGGGAALPIATGVVDYTWTPDSSRLVFVVLPLKGPATLSTAPIDGGKAVGISLP
jgi:hypothetical protein